MKQSITILKALVASAITFTASCSSLSRPQSRDFDELKAGLVRSGLTTKTEMLGWWGPPAEATPANGRNLEMLTWRHGKKVAVATFDQKGRVKEFLAAGGRIR